jgi:hypothetical protein
MLNNKVLMAMNCLIDTAERTTDLDSVYNDKDRSSIAWDEVISIRDELAKHVKEKEMVKFYDDHVSFSSEREKGEVTADYILILKDFFIRGGHAVVNGEKVYSLTDLADKLGITL